MSILSATVFMLRVPSRRDNPSPGRSAAWNKSSDVVKMLSNSVSTGYPRIKPARTSKRINEELFVECMGILQREN